MFNAVKRCLALLAVLVLSTCAVKASEGYPWWLTVPVTPTSGYIRIDTAYGTNYTSTVVRLLGSGVTAMTNAGRTSMVYFAASSTPTSGEAGAHNGLWVLSQNLSNLTTATLPQAWEAGLWKLNNDGSVSPSSNSWYDTLWTTNTLGAIIPR